MHTSPVKQRAGLGSQNKGTQAPRHTVCAREADTRAHKPRDTECAWEAETSAHKPRDSEGEPWVLRDATQVTAMQKDPHKHLPTKFLPAADGGTGEQKYRQ